MADPEKQNKHLVAEAIRCSAMSMSLTSDLTSTSMVMNILKLGH
jgi:hypothetical protein